MAISKLIPQYLNSDTDQKLVKSVEMTDSLNVRASNDAEGTDGVIKNVKGTEVVGAKTAQHQFPAGENRVIGSVANEKSKEVIFFLWNSNANHGIYRIETDINKFVKVYEDSVLNFQKYAHVSCDVILNEQEETLVYFTDNVNPPMKVNVTRLLAGGYPATLTTGTDEEKLSNITVVKNPPLSPPSYNIVNNSSLQENNIKDKVFQFAYKYVYTDGEHSALSPYSTLSVASSQYKDGFVTESAKNFYNQINVFVKNSKSDVKEILVYAKERNNGAFFQIEKLENNNSGGVQTVNFSNNKLGTPLSLDEVNKTYDNVPQKAKSVSIANNRLMFGNYTEGYENIDTDVDTLVNYEKNPDIYNISISIGGGDSYPDAYFDFSALPSTVVNDSVVYLNFTFSMKNLKISEMDALANENNTAINSFVVYKDENDSTNIETKRYPLSVVKASTGIRGDLNDVLVKESIQVSAGSTLNQVKNLIISKLTSNKYYSMMTPIKGEDAYSILNTSGTTPFSTQSGRFEGRIEFEVSNFSAGSAEVFRLRPTKAELQLVDFFSANSKKVEIVETSTIVLDLTRPEFSDRRGIVSLDKKILNGGTFMNDDFDYGRSFKAGSSHKLGLLYFDESNRASGVQELDSVYVNHFNDRADENDHQGKSSIIARIKHNAPAWAKKWSFAYTGMGDNELKLFYSVNGAFVPKFFPKNSGLSSYNKTIYLSLNGLFGKTGSYTNVSGADIEYKFEKGDKLRVVNFNGNTTPYVFDVIGFKTLISDPESNPILSQITDNSVEATTGEFLILKENSEATGFTSDSIINKSSNWFSNCVVEIYRSRKIPEEKVYYQVGKTYDVLSGNHKGEERPSSISFTLVNGQPIVSAEKLFKGDVFQTASGSITIDNVWVKDGDYYATYTDRNVPQVPDGSYNLPVFNDDPVVQLSQGDVHFRPRALFAINNQINDEEFKEANSYNAIIEYIEDYSVSDFFESRSSDIGKPFAYIPESKTTRRKSSITYSEAFVLDSDRLPLSSFNLSLANWTDLDLMYGGIDAMVNRGDALTVLQESKASQIPIGRNLIEYANGSGNVAVSKNVLGTPSYYAGDFGTSGNPESVIERFGVVYYSDLNSRKVIRLSADGITPISEKGMDSYFQSLFEDLEKNAAVPKVVGGFDPDNNEYILTVEDMSQSNIAIASSDPELEPTTYEVEINEDGEYQVEATYATSALIWNNIAFNWNDICGDWEDVGNGILNLNTSSLLIDDVFIGSTGTIKIIVTDSTESFVAIADYNIGTELVTMPSATCSGQSISLNFGNSESKGATISYSHRGGKWKTKYSFQPSNYAFLGNSMYSFFENENGLAWIHNTNETRNNFYGVQYKSVIEVVSNQNPSMVKTFQAMGVEGGGNWSSVLNNFSQKTEISQFDKREGHQYAMIPRDILNSTSHKIYLGIVESISGNKITFTTPINRVPFVIGDIIRLADGDNLNPTSLTIQNISDRKTIICSLPVFSISVGDSLFVEHNSLVDGDPMRDVYLKIRMTSEDSTPFELHALSVHYDRSRLHNDRVN